MTWGQFWCFLVVAAIIVSLSAMPVVQTIADIHH